MILQKQARFVLRCVRSIGRDGVVGIEICFGAVSALPKHPTPIVWWK